ncbi:Agamous-like MADS-box protein AGL62 [Linum perenne]
MEYPPTNMNDDSSSSEDSNNNIDVNENPTKKTRGRQKIQMRQIEKGSDKMITFSKRRAGIYKKASELVAMTGCKIGFLVFSPAGKAFSFAHPSFDYIANRFMGVAQPPLMPENLDPKQARIDELAERYNESFDIFDAEQKKEVVLKGLVAKKPMNNWWNRSVDDVAPEEIQGLENAFLEVFNRVVQRKRDILMLFKNDNNNNYNNVMNMDGVGGGGSVYASFGMQQQQSVDMGQTNVVMSMGPTLMPSFPVVGPSEAAGSSLMARLNAGAEVAGSSSMARPNVGADVVGSSSMARPNVGGYAVDSSSMARPNVGGNGDVDSSNIS